MYKFNKETSKKVEKTAFFKIFTTYKHKKLKLIHLKIINTLIKQKILWWVCSNKIKYSIKIKVKVRICENNQIKNSNKKKK